MYHVSVRVSVCVFLFYLLNQLTKFHERKLDYCSSPKRRGLRVDAQLLRKVTISFCLSTRLPVCPRRTAHVRPEVFSRILMYGIFIKICRHFPILVRIEKKTGILYGNLCTFT